jgi:L-rhamnose isomerase
MQEIVRSDVLDRVYMGTDYFDASMNRVGAWVIGARSVSRALLTALLEPTEKIRKYEEEGNMFAKLALLENLKFMPLGDVWDYYCEKNDVPADSYYIDDIMDYEKQVMSKRG